MSKANSIYRAISLLTVAGLFASLSSCADDAEPVEGSETTTRVWISRQTGAGALGIVFAYIHVYYHILLLQYPS